MLTLIVTSSTCNCSEKYIDHKKEINQKWNPDRSCNSLYAKHTGWVYSVLNNIKKSEWFLKIQKVET